MWIVNRNRMEDEKLKEMFGEELPPDDDPRWKEFDRWMEGLEREKKQEFQREDKEMDEELECSLKKSARARK